MTAGMNLSYYAKYTEQVDVVKHVGQYLSYDFPGLPQPVDGTWMAYSMMVDEFARELANGINQLTDYTHRLSVWETVICGAPKSELHSVIHELIQPISTVALLMPYALRARFAFAMAHLCHQANRLKLGSQWSDNLVEDSNIDLKDSASHGTFWLRYGRLHEAVQDIGNKSHVKSVGDFRNSWNHRFSPRVELGITQPVLRTGVGASAKYVLGAKPPIPLRMVVEALHAECLKCCKAFDRFRSLVEEHIAAIGHNQPPASPDEMTSE